MKNRKSTEQILQDFEEKVKQKVDEIIKQAIEEKLLTFLILPKNLITS